VNIYMKWYFNRMLDPFLIDYFKGNWNVAKKNLKIPDKRYENWRHFENRGGHFENDGKTLK
jgi:hypothetical protein